MFVIQDKTYKNFYGYLNNGYWSGVRRFNLNEKEVFIFDTLELAQEKANRLKLTNYEIKEIIYSYNYDAYTRWNVFGYFEWGEGVPKLCYRLK